MFCGMGVLTVSILAVYSNDACRISNDNRVIGDIMDHNTACTNNDIVANIDPANDADVAADIDTITQNRRSLIVHV